MATRTNIVLDDELVARAMAKAGVSTKKVAVEAALRAYVRAPDWKGLLALAGSGALADDYDPKRPFAGDSGVRHVASLAAACGVGGEPAADAPLRLTATVRSVSGAAGRAPSTGAAAPASAGGRRRT